MLIIKKILILFWAIALLSSCGDYLENKKTTPDFKLSTDQYSNLNFTTIKESVLVPRCISCHQQYDSYQGVIRELSAIQSAVNSNRMPKSNGPLSIEQKAILESWIEQGAPNELGTSFDPNSPEVVEPNWKSISENIIFPKCLVCHNTNGQAKFLILSSRQEIFDNRKKLYSGGSKFIDLDFPEKSYLIEVLRDEEQPMPPTETNIPRLNPNEIKTIEEWIRLGLP